MVGGLDIARAIASVQAVIAREMASRDELTRRTSATLDIGPRARERDAQEHPLVSHPGAMLQNLSVRSSDDTRVRGNEARGGQKKALAAKDGRVVGAKARVAGQRARDDGDVWVV